MTPNRETLLDPALKISPKSMAWYFTCDYYDGPISGLAIYQGRVVRFCCFGEDLPNQTIFVLQNLTETELAEEERIKTKFETMVGTHWSFEKETGKPLPRFLAEEVLSKRFYEEESERRTRATPSPTDRPIVAWFDLATQ